MLHSDPSLSHLYRAVIHVGTLMINALKIQAFNADHSLSPSEIYDTLVIVPIVFY